MGTLARPVRPVDSFSGRDDTSPGLQQASNKKKTVHAHACSHLNGISQQRVTNPLCRATADFLLQPYHSVADGVQVAGDTHKGVPASSRTLAHLQGWEPPLPPSPNEDNRELMSSPPVLLKVRHLHMTTKHQLRQAGRSIPALRPRRTFGRAVVCPGGAKKRVPTWRRGFGRMLSECLSWACTSKWTRPGPPSTAAIGSLPAGPMSRTRTGAGQC